MASVYPQVGQVAILNLILGKAGALDEPLILRLYSNDRTPSTTDDVTDYTEVVGGGYLEVALSGALFTVTAADPSVAVYDDFITFTFTGVTDSPGVVYGAYIVDQNDILVAAHRFVSPPYTPIAASLIKFKPRITLASAA